MLPVISDRGNEVLSGVCDGFDDSVNSRPSMLGKMLVFNTRSGEVVSTDVLLLDDNGVKGALGVEK